MPITYLDANIIKIGKQIETQFEIGTTNQNRKTYPAIYKHQIVTEISKSTQI